MRKLKTTSVIFFVLLFIFHPCFGIDHSTIFLKGDPHFIHHANDPVNLRNGNLYLPSLDININATNANLTIERFYNSFLSSQDGPLGFGWKHNYMTRVSERALDSIVIEESDGFLTAFWLTEELKTILAGKITQERKKLDITSGKAKPENLYTEFKNKLIGNPQYLSEMTKNYLPDLKKAPNGSYYSSQRMEQILTKSKKGYVRNFSDGTREFFDPAGKLIRIEDRNSNSIALQYRNKRLVRVSDRMGLALNINHNQDGRISSIKDFSGRTLQYFYDKNGNLIKTMGFRSEAELYSYDTSHKITGIEVANGGKVKIEYDQKMRVAKQTGPGEKITQYAYNTANGILLGEVTDSRDNKTTFKFDKRENKTVEINPLGGTKTSFFNSENGKLKKIINEAGFTTEFIYDGTGNLIRTVSPLGYVTQFSYGGPFNQLESINEAGATTRFSYDKRGNLVSKVFPNGDKISYSYDDHGNLIKLVDPTGKMTTIKYDQYGNLRELINPLGNPLRFESDILGRLSSLTNPNGEISRITYDNSDNVASITDPLGRVTKIQYNFDNKPLEIVDPRGARTKYEYNTIGLVSSKENPLGQKTFYKYDPLGNLLEATDPQGNLYSYQYDTLNRLTKEKNPLGQTLSYKYDSLGNLISYINETGLTESYEYDGIGRVTRIIYPNGKDLSLTYGEDSIIYKDERGNRTYFKFDIMDRIVQKITPEGVVNNYAYDFNSRLVEEKTSLGKHFEYSYDPLGRMVEVREGKKMLHKYNYDTAGNMIEQIDGSGSKWTFKYDSVGNLTDATNPAGGTVSFKYSSQGNVTQFSDPLGNKETYRYNNQGQLVAKTSANGEVDFYEYDRLGRVSLKQLSSGEKLFISYDPKGNLAKISDGKNVLTKFTYDQLGRIALAQNESSFFSFKYDSLDRLIQERDIKREREINFSYDEFGNLSRILDGKELLRAYTYNKLNLLAEVKDELGKSFKLEYNNENLPVKIVYPNGVSVNYKYNNLSRIESIISSSREGTELFKADYEYDSLGNLVKGKSSLGSKTYYYDKLKRLVQAETGKGSKYTYEYDQNGNRISEKIGSDKRDYQYDNLSRLIKVQDTKFDYDSQGNLKTKVSKDGPTNFYYDPFGQLIKVNKNSETVLDVSYDPFGRKYSSIQDGKKTFYRYFGLDTLFEEDEVGKRLRSFTYDSKVKNMDFLLGIIEKGKSLYPLRDAQGNVVKVTSDNGKVVESISYEPFGKPTNNKTIFESSLAFASRPYDKETGLSDFRYRYFDTETGRFLTKDPLSPVSGINPYTYPANNPVNYRDPLGLVSFGSKTPTARAGTGSGVGPGPGPSTGGTPTGFPPVVQRPNTPSTSLFKQEKMTLPKLLFYQVAIPWGLQQLGSLMKENFSDITSSFTDLEGGTNNPLAGVLVKITQKIFGVGNYSQKGGGGGVGIFEKDLVTHWGDNEWFTKNCPWIKGPIEWLSAYKVRITDSEGPTTYNRCDILEKLNRAQPKRNVYSKTSPSDPRTQSQYQTGQQQSQQQQTSNSSSTGIKAPSGSQLNTQTPPRKPKGQ